jgi:hypothetical protein
MRVLTARKKKALTSLLLGFGSDSDGAVATVLQ